MQIFDCICFGFVIDVYFLLPLNPSRVRDNEAKKIPPMFTYRTVSQKYFVLHFFIVAVI